MRPKIDGGGGGSPAAGGRAATRHRGMGREAGPPAPTAGTKVVLLVVLLAVASSSAIIFIVIGEVVIEGRGGRGGGEQGEYRKVLAEGLDAVADDGRVAAAGAADGGVGGRSEHLGQAGLAEAVAAVEEEGGSLLLVIPRVAHGTARHPHN